MTASDHDGLYLPGDAALPPHDIGEPPTTNNPSWSDVPWRTIVGAVGVVLATYIVLVLLMAAVRIIVWISIAGFLAIVLAPVVGRLNKRKYVG